MSKTKSLPSRQCHSPQGFPGNYNIKAQGPSKTGQACGDITGDVQPGLASPPTLLRCQEGPSRAEAVMPRVRHCPAHLLPGQHGSQASAKTRGAALFSAGRHRGQPAWRDPPSATQAGSTGAGARRQAASESRTSRAGSATANQGPRRNS